MPRTRKRLAVLAGRGVAFAAHLSSGAGSGGNTSGVAVSSTISSSSTSTYSLTTTTSTNPDHACEVRSFSTPLTVQLASAAG